MKITKETSGVIWSVESDCGRVAYYPQNQSLIIDGRHVWRGQYMGDDGYVGDEDVEPTLWDLACGLRHEVDGEIERRTEESREQRLDRQAAVEEQREKTWSKIKGSGINDPNTF